MRARVGVVALLGIALGVRRGAADAPVGQYTIQADGTVDDNMTKLTWQRGVPPDFYAWADAATYCKDLGLKGSGWRLPSMKELQTIVDESRSSPAIDASAFPDTPAGPFWTSSPVAGAPSGAWKVGFDAGSAYSGGVSDTLHVRCVRSRAE